MARATADFGAPVESAAGNTDGALGSLTNLLPEPAEGVTFQEILNFRRRNREPLEAFRFFLDELALRIQANPSSLSHNHEHERLDQAIAEIWDKAREQQFAARRSSFGSVLSMVWEGVGGAVDAIAVASVFDFPLANAAMIGALAGAAAGALKSPEGFILSKAKLAKFTGMPAYAVYLLAARDEGIIAEPAAAAAEERRR